MCLSFPMLKLWCENSNAFRGISSTRDDRFCTTRWYSMPSFLAPFLESRVNKKDKKRSEIQIFDLQTYFLLWLVTEPAQKSPAYSGLDATNSITLKRIWPSKKSVITRAHYYQLVASNAWFVTSFYQPCIILYHCHVRLLQTNLASIVLCSGWWGSVCHVVVDSPVTNALVAMEGAGGHIVPTFSFPPQIIHMQLLSEAMYVYMFELYTF